MVSLVYIRKEEKLKIHDLCTHLKKLGKKQQIKPRKEKKGNKDWNSNETVQRKISKTRSWFFEKTNKIDKPLAKIITGEREKA